MGLVWTCFPEHHSNSSLQSLSATCVLYFQRVSYTYHPAQNNSSSASCFAADHWPPVRRLRRLRRVLRRLRNQLDCAFVVFVFFLWDLFFCFATIVEDCLVSKKRLNKFSNMIQCRCRRVKDLCVCVVFVRYYFPYRCKKSKLYGTTKLHTQFVQIQIIR